MPRLTRLVALVAAFAAASPLAAAPAAGASPDVVISQVYGGGGNAGATLTNAEGALLPALLSAATV